MTLNEASGSNTPGSGLCTLSDPATFAASSVNTFDAPTTDPCPALAASTTYFVVIERQHNDTDAISYKTTLLNAEDSGGATGWSIDYSTYSFETAASAWGRSATQSILIEVKGSAVLISVTISSDGVLTFAKTPNYEEPEDSGGDNGYEFTVVATDLQSGSSRRSVGTAVTVTVGDVEEAGTVTADNLNPAAGETVTFRLTDPDGGIDTSSITSISWAIESLATGGSWTRVTGVLTPASTTFPWTVDEDETGKAIRAMVTYTDRRGSGKTALSQETAEVTVQSHRQRAATVPRGQQLVCRGGPRRRGRR